MYPFQGKRSESEFYSNKIQIEFKIFLIFFFSLGFTFFLFFFYLLHIAFSSNCIYLFVSTHIFSSRKLQNIFFFSSFRRFANSLRPTNKLQIPQHRHRIYYRVFSKMYFVQIKKFKTMRDEKRN